MSNQLTFTSIYNLTDLFLEFALENVSGEKVSNALQNFIMNVNLNKMNPIEKEAFEQAIKDLTEHHEELDLFSWTLKIKEAIKKLVGGELINAYHAFEQTLTEIMN